MSLTGVRETATVFCPRHQRTIPTASCHGCPSLTKVETSALECAVEERPVASVGRVLRAVAICVRSSAPLALIADLLGGDAAGGRPAVGDHELVAVVDDDDRYVGVITPREVRAFPRGLRERLAAGGCTSPGVVVDERSSLSAAAEVLVRAHARAAVVVNEAGAFVGMLDDLALLRGVTAA